MVSTYITHKLVRLLVLLVKVITCRSCVGLGIWAGEQVEIYTNTILEIKSWAELKLSSSMGIGLGP